MLPEPPTLLCPRIAPPVRLADLLPAPASPPTPFADIQDPAKTTNQIQAAFSHDESRLYLAARVTGVPLLATHTTHDANIFEDNAFELFVDPDGDGHHYFEWEVNALGATLDLLMDRPYVCGGRRDDSWEPHPDIHLATDASSQTLEIVAAFPFPAFTHPAITPLATPSTGDIWRVNLMQVVHPTNPQTRPDTQYWLLAPTGLVDAHRPHAFARLVFTNDPHHQITPDPTWPERALLAQTSGLATRPRAQGLPDFTTLPLPPEISCAKIGDSPALASKNLLLTQEGRFLARTT